MEVRLRPRSLKMNTTNTATALKNMSSAKAYGASQMSENEVELPQSKRNSVRRGHQATNSQKFDKNSNLQLSGTGTDNLKTERRQTTLSAKQKDDTSLSGGQGTARRGRGMIDSQKAYQSSQESSQKKGKSFKLAGLVTSGSALQPTSAFTMQADGQPEESKEQA